MQKVSLMWAAHAVAALILANVTPAAAQDRPQNTRGENGAPYEEGEIVGQVSDFFQMTTKDTAKAVQGIFARFGKPNAYIEGEEGSGAIVFGLRYGKGLLYRKGYAPVTVYWQGPSIGFDVGGNGSKCFTLVYNLPNTDAIFQRFPGVEGTFYFVAGIGVNYQQNGDIILAPMRTGLGVRAGVNAGYLSYSRERNWVPL
jgi:hypothetical protein